MKGTVGVQASWPGDPFVAICFQTFIFRLGRSREQSSELASWGTRYYFDLETAIVDLELYHLVVDKRPAFNQIREASSGNQLLNTGFSLIP